jgi:hypothetical protein
VHTVAEYQGYLSELSRLKLYDVDKILALVRKYLPNFVDDITDDHKDYLELFATEAKRQ